VTGGEPAPRRRRDTLTGRLVLLGVLTALVTVLAVGLVSVGLVRSAALAQAQSTLARQADVLARLTTALPFEGEADLVAAAAELQRQGVSVVLLRGTDDVPPEVPVSLVASALRTGAASGVAGDPPSLVEVRRVATSTAVALTRPASAAVNDVATPVLQRLAVALVVGLGAATLAGVLAARRLARPLSRTAEAARVMSTGQRSVRLDPEGPAEVADVALALNGLADALERSETRQRRFLLSVSHELRTPLTAIRGYAEALADGVVPPEGAASAGAVIGGEAGRLDRLMADLLALARAEADDFAVDLVDLDLAPLVREAALAWTEPCRQAGQHLRLELPDRPVPARADPVRTRQVIDALMGNATRITPPGCPIVLAAHLEPDGTPALQVRDGGPGLSDDDLPVAFDQGVLRDRYEGVRPGGSGLGLALVDRLARRMGGAVSAGHAPEGGACFTLRLAPQHSPPG
jgi:two-component system sensor histidine kinase BaeS